MDRLQELLDKAIKYRGTRGMTEDERQELIRLLREDARRLKSGK